MKKSPMRNASGYWVNFVRFFIELNERLIFEPRLAKFYRSLPVDEVKLILDVGANVGQSIDFFRKRFPLAHIHAFEPNGKLFERLNGKYGNDPNVSLHQLGVSNRNGTLTFNENILHSTSSFETPDLNSDYLKTKARVLGVKPSELITTTYPVAVTTLASFLEKNDLGRIDILKIDVEGHERACLEGLFAAEDIPSVNYIQLERHQDDMYSDDELEESNEQLLSRHGYREVAVIRHGFGDFEETIYRKAP